MNGRIGHPRLVCVVLLALAMLCCNALSVPDTLTSTIDEVTVTALRVAYPLLPSSTFGTLLKVLVSDAFI